MVKNNKVKCKIERKNVTLKQNIYFFLKEKNNIDFFIYKIKISFFYGVK